MPAKPDHLDVSFAAEPLRSAPKLLARATSLYFSAFPAIAVVTLTVFLPIKLVIQLICAASGISDSQWGEYTVSSLSDLFLGALVAPAVVHLLVSRLRTRRSAIGPAFEWASSLYGKSLWNEIKMEVTVALWALLIIIPGIVAQVRLSFTQVIVAVEGRRTQDVLNRSRQLAKGHAWTIFFVILAFGVFELIIWGGLLRLKLGMAITDSLLALVAQWQLAALLLLYLGIIRASEPASK